MAQNPFGKFLEDLDLRDQAHGKIAERIETRWDRFYNSTHKDYYVYSEDGRVRRRVNFQDETPDQGFLEVTVVDADSEKQARLLLSNAIEKALHQRAGKQELLKDQVLLNGLPLTKKNVHYQQVELEKKVEQSSIKTAQGDKTVYTVKLQLAQDHLKRRAKIYAPLVEKYARQFKISTPLVFSVIHTESYFNPKAKSSVAFGLMQLVPKWGAREAYRKVFKRDKLVGPSYLYDPENIIRLGVAYLSVLNQTFARISNQQSRMHLVISAYNTGPRNVSRAFSDRASLMEAFPKIQAMQPEGVYNHLLRNLPYEETRHYIVKVNKRMPLYH